MNIVFMGTPEFAVRALRMLIEEEYNVVAVVSQPDRPRGRKRELMPTPVKVEAVKHGIPVIQPERLRHPDAVEQIQGLQPDVIVTAAYGQILPKSVLDMPKYGCINIHASLLPKYRGGAPIHHAIMNGEKVTGVTIMYMAEGLDTGDMISKVEVTIGEADNTGTMFEKLSEAGADLLRRTLPDLLAGKTIRTPQNHDQATYASNVKREDERIDWTRTALQIYNQVRGLSPEPGAFTYWNGDILKVRKCALPRTLNNSEGGEPMTSDIPGIPGTVIQCVDDGIEVATGNGTIWLTEIQPAGKRKMSVADFRRGSTIVEGTVLDDQRGVDN